jgi:hypothetical protein
MNAAHAAVTDHEQITDVAFRHLDQPAFGAPTRHVAHLDNVASRRFAYRALELRACQPFDQPPAACPRPEHRDHMNESYLCLRGGRDRHGERREVRRVL